MTFKPTLVVLFAVCVQLSLHAQSKSDSIQHRTDSLLSKRTHSLDSAKNQLTSGIDSISNLGSKASHLTDSITPDLSKYNRRLEAIKGRLSHRIDSLNKLGQPSSHYSHLLDSINKAGPLKDIRQARDKISSLERTATAPVGKVSSAINNVNSKVNEKLGLLNKEGGAAANIPGSTNIPTLPGGKTTSLPGVQTGIPNVNAPGMDANLPGVPNAGSTPNTNLPAGQLPNVNAPQQQLGNVMNNSEVKDIQQQAGKMGDYTTEVQNISKGDLDKTKELQKGVESKAMSAEGMDKLKDGNQSLDQLEALKAKGNDPDAMKKLALEQAKQQAVNHFAGKEKVLEGAMQQISQLKKKYSSLASLKDIPKHIPNDMHGKPFIERLVPGITWQLQVKGHVLIDMEPVLGYRLTGHFTVGGGWNERRGISHWHVRSYDRIYGPRAFVDYKLAKGWSVRTDVETMNAKVPTLNYGGYSEGSRRWVWGLFLGIKREYKFSKSIKGNVQTMYNFLDPIYRANPYADRFNVRMGLDFPIKKKGKEAADKAKDKARDVTSEVKEPKVNAPSLNDKIKEKKRPVRVKEVKPTIPGS